MANGRSLKVVANEAKLAAPRKLDIACGQNKQKGFKGIDLAGDADIVWDLFNFPWPIKTSSVQEAYCSHFVEHIPHVLPGVDKDGFFAFFEEVQRILRKNGTIEIIHPFNRSDRAFWDPTHQRFLNDVTWYYLDPEWRAQNKLDHYNTDANFEVTLIDAAGIPDEVMARPDEQRMFQMTRYWNVIADLRVILKVRK